MQSSFLMTPFNSQDHLTNVSVLLSLQRRKSGKVDQGGINKAMP